MNLLSGGISESYEAHEEGNMDLFTISIRTQEHLLKLQRSNYMSNKRKCFLNSG